MCVNRCTCAYVCTRLHYCVCVHISYNTHIWRIHYFIVTHTPSFVSLTGSVKITFHLFLLEGNLIHGDLDSLSIPAHLSIRIVHG